MQLCRSTFHSVICGSRWISLNTRTLERRCDSTSHAGALALDGNEVLSYYSAENNDRTGEDVQRGDSGRTVRFGPFELHPDRRELCKQGVKIRLAGKAYLVLMRLLERPGEPVSREELRLVLWPNGTFVDFDHSLNAVVNRLRSQLQDSAESQHYIETVPGVGYRFVGSLQGSLLPVEAARQDGASCSVPDEPPRNRTILLRVAAVLSICAVAVVITIAARQTVVPHSLVLLPFQNLSSSPENDFLAEGFTDAIATELGRSSGLNVISPTSGLLYKRSSKPLRTIAEELHAQYVVEGAVLPMNSHARVNVRLVHAAPDRYLWSKSYDVDLDGAARMEIEIAQAIASEINAELLPRPQSVSSSVSSVSASAYEAYLKGKYMLARGTEESIRKSIDYLRTSIVESPDYANAYAALAESYTALSTVYAAPNEVMPEARNAADTALRLDDTLSSAHAIRGKIAILYDWNWQDAEKHLRKAIALNGSLASAHVAYVDLLVARGRYEEAAGEVRKAQMLDPVSLANSTDLVLDAFDAEKFDVLDVSARKALEIDPDFSWAHTLLGWVAARKGNISDGLAQAERGARNASSFEQLALLGEVQLMANRKQAAQDTLEKLMAQRRNRYVCGHAIALLCGAMGRKEEAMQWLETAYRERSDCMPFLKGDPATAAMHMEPRFQRLVRQVDGGG